MGEAASGGASAAERRAATVGCLPCQEEEDIEKGKLKKQQQPADRCEEQEGGEAKDVAAVEE